MKGVSIALRIAKKIKIMDAKTYIEERVIALKLMIEEEEKNSGSSIRYKHQH